MDEFKWIKSFLKDKEFRPSTISAVVPDRFERYSLIHRTIGIIDDFPFSDYPSDKDSLENLNKQHEIERQFGLFLNSDPESKYRECSLKELAKKFQVDYSINTINLIPDSPGVAILPLRTEKNLEQFLTRLNDLPLRLFIQDYYRYFHLEPDFYQENSVDNISDYLGIMNKVFFDSNSFLFPLNLRWCLITLEDFGDFIFCSDNHNYERVKDFSNLEIFEVDYDFSLW